MGMVFAPLPVAAAQTAFAFAAGEVSRRHADAFGRLESDSTILVDPLDLPWRFMLRPGRTPPELKLVGRNTAVRADATIRAPVSALVALLEGRVDGDALFFARDLVIEGDTEAVVALRNAVDGADIRVVEDVLARLGPLAGAASWACRGLFWLAESAAARIERVMATTDTAERAGG